MSGPSLAEALEALIARVDRATAEAEAGRPVALDDLDAAASDLCDRVIAGAPATRPLEAHLTRLVAALDRLAAALAEAQSGDRAVRGRAAVRAYGARKR